MSKTLGQIRNASKPGYSAKISIADALLEAHWCEEDDLLLAYQTLQESDLDIAIVLFQLPFLIRLPEKWIPIRAEYGHPSNPRLLVRMGPQTAISRSLSGLRARVHLRH